MFRNILLSAWASLKRKKLVSIFTILTISLGMSMIVLLSAVVNTFSGNIGPNQNRDRCLFVADMKFGEDGQTVQRERYTDASLWFANKLQELQTPESVAIYGGRSRSWNIGTTYKPNEVKFLQTDANFWDVYQFQFIQGRGFIQKEIENSEKVCVLSRSAAMYLFNSTDIIGKQCSFYEMKFKVVGIIENEHALFDVAADLYVPYTSLRYAEDNSYKNSVTGKDIYYNRGAYKVALMVRRGESFSDLRNEYQSMIGKINRLKNAEEFEEIRSGLLRPIQLMSALLIGGDGEGILTLALIMLAGFLLVPIIILSNVNLYALRERIEEIGVRKSYGASRKNVVLQFLIENVALTLIGTILAVLIALPLNRFLCSIVFHQKHMVGMNLNLQFISLLAAGAVLFGVVTVVIPAFRISKVRPAIAIQLATKSDTNSFLGRSRKKWTIVLSHMLLFTVLSLGAFFTSSCYLNSFKGLGYNPKNVLTIMVEENGKNEYSDDYNSTKFAGFKEKLLRINGIKQVSYVLENPPDWIVPQYKEYINRGDEVKIRTLETDHEFFEILGYEPQEGELYSKATISPKYIYGVVTQTAQRKYFEGNAVGKILKRKEDGKPVMIIGVVDKYKHHIMADDYNGIFTLRNCPSRSIILHYDENTNAAQLEKEIRTLVEGNYSNCFLNHNCDIEASTHQSLEKLYSMFYGIVFIMGYLLFITLLGFLTLGWYNVRSRRKELGVRRSVGASKQLIKRKIISENLFLMLLGSSISALLLSQGLLLIIPDDRKIFLWIGLLVAFILCLVMNLISVYLPAIRAARVTPVEALAEE